MCITCTTFVEIVIIMIIILEKRDSRWKSILLAIYRAVGTQTHSEKNTTDS